MFLHVRGRSKASVQHVRIYLCGIYKAFLCQVLPGTIYPRYVCQRPLPARWVLWKCHLNLNIYIYISLSLSLSLLPDVKIIHYFLRRKPYFNFEKKKSTQRPTQYYNSANLELEPPTRHAAHGLTDRQTDIYYILYIIYYI